MQEKEHNTTKRARPSPSRVAKVCGGDVEVGNFILGAPDPGRGADAAQALLREIEGQPHVARYSQVYGAYSWCDSDGDRLRAGGSERASGASGGGDVHRFNPQDWGRKFLRSNGACAYIDLCHLELCIPEVRAVRDYVAYTRAMLRIARQAQIDANEKLPPGRRIQVLANNSDGRGNSYGSHLNFLLTRPAWENIFHRKIHYLLWLAAYQVSSIVFAGQGKVGSENGRPDVPYQISARADFFETLLGEQTTYRRPIVNARDESLCGSAPFARLHVIFYDNTLCDVASLLKVGVMQIVLAMLESDRVNPRLILDDPVAAGLAWSHDPTLRVRARTLSGMDLTALDLQMFFIEDAARFVEEGGCDEIVPQAREILERWDDTVTKLRRAALAGEPEALEPLAPRLDWVLKLGILRRAMQQHPELTWDAPQLKHLDHLYSSLDPHEGLYWAYERSGFVERVVTAAEVERCMHEPPADTRAWTRAMLLRAARPEDVRHVDWDSIRLKVRRGRYGPEYRTLDMDDLTAFTRAAAETAIRGSADIAGILDALGAPDESRLESNGSETVAAADSVTAPSSSLVSTASSEDEEVPDTDGRREDTEDTVEHEGEWDHEVS